jgi:hypothetical protein
MVGYEVMPAYWRHLCPAASSEDGDRIVDDEPDLICAHQHVEYTIIPNVKLKSISDANLQSLLGKKCCAEGCKYTVTEETVIVNNWPSMKPICNIGGKNIYPGRTDVFTMRCCGGKFKSCGKTLAKGHPSKPGPGHFRLEDARDQWCYHSQAYSEGKGKHWLCSCVWVNARGEPIRTWEPEETREKEVLVADGPLALDLKYFERKYLGSKEKSQRNSKEAGEYY